MATGKALPAFTDVVCFESGCGLAALDISAQFPNLRALQLDKMILLPDSGDWSPLTAFLARRASSGDRLSSLTISWSHVCPEAKERIGSVVQVFHHVGSVK